MRPAASRASWTPPGTGTGIQSSDGGAPPTALQASSKPVIVVEAVIVVESVIVMEVVSS